MLIKSAFSHFEEISILVKVGILKVDRIEEHSRQSLVHIGPVASDEKIYKSFDNLCLI